MAHKCTCGTSKDSPLNNFNRSKGIGPQGLGVASNNGFWVGNAGSPMKQTAAWTRKEGKDPKGGLNAKGVASYRAEHPGSKLQTAVTKKPSELKPGSKDANRRKSFCARMSGMPGPMKKPNGEPTRKKLALDKWNC
jgi:hypothetical protein